MPLLTKNFLGMMQVVLIFLCAALTAAMPPLPFTMPAALSKPLSSEETELIARIFPPPGDDETISEFDDPVQSFPVEIWVKILDELNAVDLLQTSRSCKRFYAIAYNYLNERLVNMDSLLLMLYGSDIRMDRAMLDMAWKHRDRLTIRQFQSYAWTLPKRLLPGLEDELDRFHEDLLPTFLDYMPFDVLTSPCFSFQDEHGVISVKRFWYPAAGERLFDKFDIDAVLIPAHKARRPDAWYYYFAPAFISQYILEAWYLPENLTDYDYECMTKFLPFVQEYVNIYMEKLIHVLYVAFGDEGYKCCKLSKDLEGFFENLGIHFPLHDMHSGDLRTLYQQCLLPMRSLFKIAGQWGIDLDLLIQKANQKDDLIQYCTEHRIPISTQRDISVKAVVSAMLTRQLSRIGTQVIVLSIDPDEITNNTGKKVFLERQTGCGRPLIDPILGASDYFYARGTKPIIDLPPVEMGMDGIGMGFPGLLMGLGGGLGLAGFGMGMGMPAPIKPFHGLPLEEFIGEPVKFLSSETRVKIEGPVGVVTPMVFFPGARLFQNFRAHMREPTFNQRILWKGSEFQIPSKKRSAEGNPEESQDEKRRRIDAQQVENPRAGEEI